MHGLPYPLNLDPDDQPYREGQQVSRDVTLFDPTLGREYGQIARVSVMRNSRSSADTAYEQYAVLWNNGEVNDGFFRHSLNPERYTAAEIAAGEQQAASFQANITWE
jgi:hypothetical protein